MARIQIGGLIMPVKVGGKGKLQSYDPNTGKFGSGQTPMKETIEKKEATVTIAYGDQIVQVVGPLTKSVRNNVEKLPSDNSMSFKEAVTKIGK